MTRDESAGDGLEPASAYWEIDALLDGEVVDTQALRSALDDVEARDYLVEVLRVRQLARDAGPAQFSVPASPRSTLVRGMRWLAAGVIVAASAGAGYVYGQASTSAASPPSAIEVVVGDSPEPPAPEPTRSIRFEPGVNWTSETRSR